MQVKLKQLILPPGQQLLMTDVSWQMYEILHPQQLQQLRYPNRQLDRSRWPSPKEKKYANPTLKLRI